MYNVEMIVSGSFLRTCVSALRARKVLDTHMGFKVPFQGTSIGKLFTSKLARFLYQLLFLLCDGALVDLAPCTLLAHPAAQNIVQRPTTTVAKSVFASGNRFFEAEFSEY